MLQMLQLNLTQYVTNVALIYLATFIIYNGITIIIKGRQKNIMKKIIGIFVVTLMIATAFASATNVKIHLNDVFNNDFEQVGIASSFGDPPGEWIKNYGMKKPDYFNFVRITDDGGFIAAGNTLTYAPGDVPIAWLVKTDSDGEMEWNKTYGADDEYGCYFYKVFQMADGGYIIVGNRGFYSDDNNGWLIKTDTNGNVQWENIFGGTNFDRCFHVIEVDDGYYLCGRTYASYDWTSSDGWVIKTDTNGNKLWDKTYGGNHYDNFYMMVKLDGGGFVLTGISSSYNVNNYKDFWCVKIDDNGNELWSKTYGGSANYTAWSIYPTDDGGYIMGGDSYDYNAQKDYYFGKGGVIVKIDGSGTMQWMKNYSKNVDDSLCWMDPTEDGGYILMGSTYNNSSSQDDIWLVKTDGSGNMEWERTFQKNIWLGSGCSVQQINDTSYIMAGTRYSSRYLAFLLKVTNAPPLQPDTPTGETNGQAKQEYTYTTEAIDSNGDQIFYLFDWGDGTNSNWLGPYNSGESVEASHTWTERNTYEVKVKAKDNYDLESVWSDPLPISIPKNKAINTPFLRFLENHPHLFPLLRQLLGV